jgi:hypothetical protein
LVQCETRCPPNSDRYSRWMVQYVVTIDGIEVMVQAAAGAALLIAIGGFAIRRTKPWVQACLVAAVALS